MVIIPSRNGDRQRHLPTAVITKHSQSRVKCIASVIYRQLRSLKESNGLEPSARPRNGDRQRHLPTAVTTTIKKKKRKRVTVNSKPTWNADVEEIGPGRTLASVGVEIQEDGAQDGEEDAPRVRGGVRFGIDDVSLANRCRHRRVHRQIVRVSVAKRLSYSFSVGHQQQTFLFLLPQMPFSMQMSRGSVRPAGRPHAAEYANELHAFQENVLPCQKPIEIPQGLIELIFMQISWPSRANGASISLEISTKGSMQINSLSLCKSLVH